MIILIIVIFVVVAFWCWCACRISAKAEQRANKTINEVLNAEMASYDDQE